MKYAQAELIKENSLLEMKENEQGFKLALGADNDHSGEVIEQRNRS